MSPLLSVLIVNYNTAALTRRCVESLRAQRLQLPDAASQEVDIVVVDNASRPEERDALQGITARVVYNDNNRGYGAALNQAVADTNSPFVLFSNSDLWYFPGALQGLLQGYGRLPHCGAVGPRLWWDLERTFLIPPIDPVTIHSYIRETLALQWSGWQQWYRRRWLRRALQFWWTQEPVVRPMLSGCCILTHRNVLSACGGFDEHFRLYYEDTDWCRRVRQKGYRLYCLPEADVTHLHNQSGRQDVVTMEQTGRASQSYYFRKHYGEYAWSLLSRMTTLRSHNNDSFRFSPCDDLGTCSEAPRFSCSPLPSQSVALWQLSPVPSGIPAIARFVSTPEDLMLSPPVWAQLGSGDFFARLFRLPDLQLLHQWHWRKVAPVSQKEESTDAP